MMTILIRTHHIRRRIRFSLLFTLAALLVCSSPPALQAAEQVKGEARDLARDHAELARSIAQNLKPGDSPILDMAQPFPEGRDPDYLD